MAWVFPDKRVCPTEGCFSERVLVIQTRNGFRLSCSNCAAVSDVMGPRDAFFRAWVDGLAPYKGGAVLELVGVPHCHRGWDVVSPPIKVLLGTDTAIIVPKGV